MKVIIINPVNYQFETLRPPFGLLTIATKFMKNGVDVIWIDADVMRDNHEVINRVKHHVNADLIAMGGMHTAYRNIKELCQSIKKEHIDLPIIIGGRVASSLDHLIWSNIPNVTMLCRQEGEYVVDSLCNNVNTMQEIAGIEYRENGKIIANAPAPIINKSEAFLPLRWELLSHKYYEYPLHTGRIITSRGCPYNCHFCRFDGQRDKYRPMKIEQIMQSVEYMTKHHDVNRIVFMDELFLLNKERVAEICDHIKAFHVSWQCSTRGDIVADNNLPLLKKMREAGCDRILMGIESGSRQILKAMNKRLDLQKTEKCIELIRKAGIRVAPTFIFGYPGETRDTALESVRWRKKMNLPHRFFYAQPYPGSELYNIWKKKFSIGPDEEERHMLIAPGLKKVVINFTDMPDWKLKFLAFECVIRLNSLAWIIMYFMVMPLKKISPKIPELMTRFAIKMKGLFHNQLREDY